MSVNALITEVSYCVLPFDHRYAGLWTVRVAWRGADQYAVCHGPYVLATDQPGVDGPEWEFEPNPSSRTDEFKARTRFDYHVAARLACEQAPLVRVNGMAAADVLARAGP